MTRGLAGGGLRRRQAGELSAPLRAGAAVSRPVLRVAAGRVTASVCGKWGIRGDGRDITADPDELLRYHDSVPVTLVDGEEHDFWRVSAQRLRRALTD